MADVTNILELVEGSQEDAEFLNRLAVELGEYTSATLVLWWELREGTPHLLGEKNSSLTPLTLKLSEKAHAELLQKANIDSPFRTNLEGCVVFFVNLRISKSIVFELMVPANCGQNSSDEKHVLEGLTQVKSMTERKFKHLVRSTSQDRLEASQFVKFSQIVLSSWRLLKTSANVANELCRVHNFDRVSVAQRRGRSWRIIAISNQEFVNRKSRAVRALEQLIYAVMQTNRVFRLNDQEYPSRIASKVEGYRECNEVRSMVVFPVSSSTDVELNDKNVGGSDVVPIASIVIESFDGEVPCEIEDTDVYLEVCRSAIRNSLRYDNLPLVGLVEAFRSFFGIDGVRSQRYRLSAILLVPLIIFLLFFIQADFYVSGKGKVLPVSRQRVYAEVDGVVTQVSVDHGSEVAAGDLLIQLRNPDLDIESEKIAGDILELDEKLRAMVASRVVNLDSKPGDERSIKGLRAQLETLKHLAETLGQKKKKLRVESPIQGQVVTWNVRETVLDRPIQRGQVLLEISQLDGRWEAVVSLPIRKVGFVREYGVHNQRVVIAIPSRSEVWFSGILEDLEMESRLEADGTQGVLAKIGLDERFDSEVSNNLVVAKIYCGKRSLGFIWLHEAWYYVQENVVFPYWPF